MSISRSHKLFLVFLLMLIGAVAFVAFNEEIQMFLNGTDTSTTNQLQTEGALPFTDLDGNPVDLTAYDDSVLVVNAWATWCPFCVNELPDLDVLAREYADQNVKILAINRKESSNTAKAFIDHVGNPEHLTFLLDPDDSFYSSIGGFAMPETLFYRQNGEIAVHKRGFMTLEEMRQHIETALATPQ